MDNYGLAASVIGNGEGDIVVGDAGEVGLDVFIAGGRGAAPGEGPFVGEVIVVGSEAMAMKWKVVW